MNLVSDQGFIARAAMLTRSETEAHKAIDNNIHTCAIGSQQPSVWWKVWLQRVFNIAYLEIHFNSNSKYIKL